MCDTVSPSANPCRLATQPFRRTIVCVRGSQALRYRVPPKRSSKVPAVPIKAIAPVIKPLLKPVVEPVLIRLDHHEKLLEDLKTALDVQFKRTAAIQVQLDQLIATLAKRTL